MRTLAAREARALNHTHVGTEHILLGLLSDDAGAPAQILHDAGVTFDAAQEHVVRVAGYGNAIVIALEIPLSSRASAVFAAASEEAIAVGSDRVEPEHVAIALLRQREGVAAQVLRDLDVDVPAMIDSLARSPRGKRSPAAAVPLFAQLAAEVREQDGRDADAGDLLLLLTDLVDPLVDALLLELGTDREAVRAAVARARQQVPASAG